MVRFVFDRLSIHFSKQQRKCAEHNLCRSQISFKMINGKLIIFCISSMTTIYHLSNEISCELTKVCITIRG